MVVTPADDALVPVTELFACPRRWVFRACRLGHIKGAIKVGRRWLISREAFKAWAASQGKGDSAPSALEELRAAGFAAPTPRGADESIKIILRRVVGGTGPSCCTVGSLSSLDVAAALFRDDAGHYEDCPHFRWWRDLGSWVYFVQVGEDGPIKIGKSDSPAVRVHGLQTGNPEALHLRAVARGGEPFERLLHKVLAVDLIRGEWFRPSHRVLSAITALTLDEQRRREASQ